MWKGKQWCSERRNVTPKGQDPNNCFLSNANSLKNFIAETSDAMIESL